MIDKRRLSKTAKAAIALRAKLDVSQMTFAEMIGVSNITISRWENGHAKPNDLSKARIMEIERNNGK